MKYRLNIRHPRINKRVHKTVDLNIVPPNKGDKLDLATLVKEGLPEIKVEATFLGSAAEIDAWLPGKMTKAEVEKVFLEDDGWAVYGN